MALPYDFAPYAKDDADRVLTLFLMARDGSLSHVQAVVALTVMTLFVPCVANFLMIVKERGLRIGLVILAVVTVIAVGTGAVLNAIVRTLHVVF